MKVQTVLVVIILALVAADTAARQPVMAGAVVDLLQRMQGKWKTGCRIDDNASRQQHLIVTFTHITVSRREFSGDECRLERQRLESRYRFTLTEPIITRRGDRAYALNLIAEDAGERDPPVRLNLVRVDAGKLILGDPEFPLSPTRPDRLDYSTVFTR